MKRFFLLQTLLLVVCMLGACSREELPPGVVATVNGAPITLRELEAKDDARGGSLMLAPTDVLTVAGLRQRYGQSLAALIVEKLILQAVAQKNLLPSDADVANAEAAVRQDYPDDEFEKILQEEFIDIDEWRTHLKNRLAVRVFQQQMLFPQIPVSDEEIAAFYASHEKNFSHPERMEFIFVSSASRQPVENVHRQMAAGSFVSSGSDVDFCQMVLPPERMPEKWVADMVAAGENRPTEVMQEENMYQFFVLKRRIPACVIPLAEVSSTIRDILAEAKSAPYFEKWIEQAASQAKIMVSPHLSAGLVEDNAE